MDKEKLHSLQFYQRQKPNQYKEIRKAELYSSEFDLIEIWRDVDSDPGKMCILFYVDENRFELGIMAKDCSGMWTPSAWDAPVDAELAESVRKMLQELL